MGGNGSASVPVERARRFAEQLRALFGDPPLGEAGVLHVVAAWRRGEGDGLEVLKVGPATPASATDRLVLEAARARADAIITTGKVLRSEPRLSHALGAAATSWRRVHLGRTTPPASLVLTHGASLDWTHPLFRSGGPVLLLTTRAAAARVADRAQSLGVRLVGRDAPGLRDAIQVARGLGARTVSIEAGPASAAELYAKPLAVDELMLSLYEEAELAAELRAGPLPPLEILEQLLPRHSPPLRIREAGGRWSFRRLRRDPA